VAEASAYAGRVDETFLEETFRLRSEFIPLCDLLKVCGVTESGGEAKHLIADGEVLVDGDVELRKRCKIRAGQVVSGLDFEIHVVAAED
jgi:ribosome-associated protein